MSNETDLTIISATADNVVQLNHIMRLSKGHWGYDEHYLNRFIDKYAITADYLKNNIVRLVYCNDTLIGFFSFLYHADQSIELDNLFLYPEYIGKGLGKKIWSFCCATAKQDGIKKFFLWSDPYSESFYEKMCCIKIGSKNSTIDPTHSSAIFQYEIK